MFVGGVPVPPPQIPSSNTKIDFSQANLSGANLSGLDLSSANLTSANLSGAVVKGCKFSAKLLHLQGANFEGVDLTDNEMARTKSGAFQGADLSKAILNAPAFQFNFPTVFSGFGKK